MAITDMNGGRGAILTKNGQPALTISLACDEAGWSGTSSSRSIRTSWLALSPSTFTS